MARQELRTFFDEPPDHRVPRTRKHNLVDIVLLVSFATILAVEGWDDIHVFGVSRLEQLRAVLGLQNGVPSAAAQRARAAQARGLAAQEATVGKLAVRLRRANSAKRALSRVAKAPLPSPAVG